MKSPFAALTTNALVMKTFVLGGPKNAPMKIRLCSTCLQKLTKEAWKSCIQKSTSAPRNAQKIYKTTKCKLDYPYCIHEGIFKKKGMLAKLALPGPTV